MGLLGDISRGVEQDTLLGSLIIFVPMVDMNGVPFETDNVSWCLQARVLYGFGSLVICGR